MATTLRDTASRLVRTAVLPALAHVGAACSCPPLVDDYNSPEKTLATWQSRLCRDDLVGEYACFAASFKDRIGGFPNYHAARAALLEQEPAAAWVFRRADLAEHVSRTEFSGDGLAARVELEAHGERIAVAFELETWLTLRWADGTEQSRRQELPLARLLGSQAGRQWLTIQRPELPPERVGDVRALGVETRWKIADISGLASPTRARADAGADSSPSDAGLLP
jgi:hypothetical protein